MRFTIRELVLVTVIVAIGLAWGLDHLALASARDHWHRLTVGIYKQYVGKGTVELPDGTKFPGDSLD
jgi:hypothetical protein